MDYLTFKEANGWLVERSQRVRGSIGSIWIEYLIRDLVILLGLLF